MPCQTEAKCPTEPHHGSWMFPHSVCFPFQSSAGKSHSLPLRRLHETPETPNSICILDLPCWLLSHWGLWLFSLAHPDDWLGQVSSSQSGHILCLQLPPLCDFRQVLWCFSVTYLPSPITSRVHGLLLSLMDWRLSMEAPRRRISHQSSLVIPGCSHFFILPNFFTLSQLTLP